MDGKDDEEREDVDRRRGLGGPERDFHLWLPIVGRPFLPFPGSHARPQTHHLPRFRQKSPSKPVIPQHPDV